MSESVIIEKNGYLDQRAEMDALTLRQSEIEAARAKSKQLARRRKKPGSKATSRDKAERQHKSVVVTRAKSPREADLSFDGKKKDGAGKKSAEKLSPGLFYARKMKYLQERSRLLDIERHRLDKEEAKLCAKVPPLSERKTIMAEMYRLKQNLINDEKFLKRVYDREANTFKVVPNPEYHYEKKPIPKRQPKHWTFDQAEEASRSKSIKKKSLSKTPNRTFPKSYKYKVTDFIVTEQKDKKNNGSSKKDPGDTGMIDITILDRGTPTCRSAKKSFDFNVAALSAKKQAATKSPLRSRENSMNRNKRHEEKLALSIERAERYACLKLGKKSL